MTTVRRNLEVPTGNILIVQGEKGLLECLSIGDYGKEANIKADFLGLRKEINGVSANDIMPLTEKWVITISTQYGCSMKCNFCDVPKVGPGRNATLKDMQLQIEEALKLHPEIDYTKRLNLHFARMGEPTFNWDVINLAEWLRRIVHPYVGSSLIHPVVSTMLPNNNLHVYSFINRWVEIKNDLFYGEAGLQFSINSTSDDERKVMFSGNSMLLEDIAELADQLPMPVGRKYTLNFALGGYEVDADKLICLFDPDKFICKLTPMHLTSSCLENGISTVDGYEKYYPYQEIEKALIEVGFDTIVFIPSKDEDESRITCGNAILSDNF